MVEQAVDYIANQTTQSFIKMFWFLLIFEIPRFVLGGGLAVYIILFKKIIIQRHVMPKEKIKLSVLIPTHNNGEGVAKTVNSLRELVGVELQIIVINDGSTDTTDLLCKSLFRRGLIHDYLHMKSRGGKASALNAGMTRVKHDFVLGTDADTTFNRDAILNSMGYFDKPNVACVSGNLRLRNVHASLCTRFQQLNYVASITISRVVKDMIRFYFVSSGAFSIFRAEAIRSVGGWNYGPGDDSDMSIQLRLAGWRIHFAPYAIATTDGPLTFKALGRQRLRWFRSTVRVRYRKFKSINLNPFNANFSFLRAFSFYEAFFVQGLLPVIFILYVVGLIYSYGAFALIILFTIHFFYAILFFIEFCIYLCISTNRREDVTLIPYIVFYSQINIYFLRAVAFYATFNELILRGSYTDAFYPEKVRTRVKKF